MDYIHWFQENFIHLDKSLEHIVSAYGIWVYAILFAIIFSETGLVITPFLPGDALLFAVGAYSVSHPDAGLKWPIAMGLLMVAAVLGNLVNFTIGSTVGGKIFKENALILKKEYLDKTHLFFVAGMAAMDKQKFTLYTVAGSFLWVFLMMIAGVLFGQIDWVQKHFEAVVLGIIVVSMLPVAFEAVSQYLAAKKK